LFNEVYHQSSCNFADNAGMTKFGGI
jgi:hypothetical protein